MARHGGDNRKHKGPGNKLHHQKAVNQRITGLPNEEQGKDKRAHIQTLQEGDSKAAEHARRLRVEQRTD